MQNPFTEHEPEPAAQTAARALMQTLPVLEKGKMFGVLVVEGGEVFHAFSAGVDAEGFAPHVFDAQARAQVEPQSDVIVNALLARAVEAAKPLEERAALVRELEREREALRLTHAQRKRDRKAQREAVRDSKAVQDEFLAQEAPALRTQTDTSTPLSVNGAGSHPGLDEQSRADGRERRLFEERAEARLAVFAPAVRHHAALERLRALVSREAMKRIHDTYVFRNVLGQTTTLRALFAPTEPPWGAGECAAVKLIAHALKLGRTPVALAEFWWGPPPAGGGRVHGTFYPACRNKCGPILPFLLNGLNVDARLPFVSTPRGELEVLHEDSAFLVLCKPAGLLSVPGKDTTDSVLERLQVKHPGVRLVHRLDLDTSGVLLAARDDETHRVLQAQFLTRSVEKRYVAWLSRELSEESGTLTLPLRVDLDARPRQMVCFEHGKPAITRWKLLKRANGRSKVAFFPETGRTHQLRVHAAHAQGLGAAIVGDPLYGKAGPRLMLHAESLSFNHPKTGERVTFTAPARF